MQLTHRGLRVLAAIATGTAVLLSTPGCTTSSSSSEDSCARLIELDGRTYTDSARVDVTPGTDLGDVAFLSCDDTGGRGEQDDTQPERATAFEIEGIDRQFAIAVGSSAEEAELFALVQPGGDLPKEVQEYIDENG